MESSIGKRLHAIEEDLLDALVDGEDALAKFTEKWTALASDIQRAIDAKLLDDSLIQSSHTISSRVAIIAETSLNLHTELDTIGTALEADLEHILAGITLGPSNKPPGPPGGNDELRNQPSAPSRQYPVSYISLAYQWLLKNLHNPYPSKAVKVSISDASGSSGKDIDAWFIEARRRIGWSALRRNYFSNRRQEIVDASTRFFLKSDPKRPLHPDLELKFANIETQATALYTNKTTEVDNVAIRDAQGICVLQDSSLQKTGSSRLQSLSPSSPSQFLSPISCTFSTSRKRSRSASGSSDSGDEGSTSRKRSRIQSDEHTDTGISSRLSIIHKESTNQVDLRNASSRSSYVPLKQKRRLSAGESHGFPIPAHISAGPRVHAVSDPLPIAGTAEEIEFGHLACFSSDSAASSDSSPILDSKFLEVELFDPAQLFVDVAASLPWLPNQDAVIHNELHTGAERVRGEAASHNATLCSSSRLISSSSGFNVNSLYDTNYPTITSTSISTPFQASKDCSIFDPVPMSDEEAWSSVFKDLSSFSFEVPSWNDFLPIDFSLTAMC